MNKWTEAKKDRTGRKLWNIIKRKRSENEKSGREKKRRMGETLQGSNEWILNK